MRGIGHRQPAATSGRRRHDRHAHVAACRSASMGRFHGNRQPYRAGIELDHREPGEAPQERLGGRPQRRRGWSPPRAQSLRDRQASGPRGDLAKGGKNRTVPFSTRATRERWSGAGQRRGAPREPALPTSLRTLRPMSGDACARHVFLRGAGVHTFRRPCVRRRVPGGVDLTHVKTWMVHASITTTLRCAHLAPRHARRSSCCTRRSCWSRIGNTGGDTVSPERCGAASCLCLTL